MSFIVFVFVCALNSTSKHNEAYDAYTCQWIELIWSDMVKRFFKDKLIQGQSIVKATADFPYFRMTEKMPTVTTSVHCFKSKYIIQNNSLRTEIILWSKSINVRDVVILPEDTLLSVFSLTHIFLYQDCPVCFDALNWSTYWYIMPDLFSGSSGLSAAMNKSGQAICIISTRTWPA